MKPFAGPAARSFRVEGKQVVCPHCENVLFHDRKATLNTRASEFFGFAWADRQAKLLICANCTRIEWFADSDAPVAEA
jgi:hypothetical protein